MLHYSQVSKHPIEPIFVTVPEALRLIGIGTTKFYEEVSAGRIELRKAGKRSLVPVASLKAWAAGLPKAEAA